jgi:hypothetical protein
MPATIAAAGIVRTEAKTMLPATPHRTAENRLVATAFADACVYTSKTPASEE